MNWVGTRGKAAKTNEEKEKKTDRRSGSKSSCPVTVLVQEPQEVEEGSSWLNELIARGSHAENIRLMRAEVAKLRGKLGKYG